MHDPVRAANPTKQLNPADLAILQCALDYMSHNMSGDAEEARPASCPNCNTTLCPTWQLPKL